MSFTRLRYHITTATKSRRRFIKPEVEPVVFDAIRKRAEEIGARVLEVNGTEDHIHIIAAIPPTLAVATFIQKVKACSSMRAGKAFPRLGFEWQAGYGAFTLNPFDFERAREYVRNQKEHHANNTVIELWERLSEIRRVG